MLSVHRWGVVQETVLFLGLGGGRAGGPEEAAAALPVVVGGGRTELLLTLVHAGLEDLEGDREEEETTGESKLGFVFLIFQKLIIYLEENTHIPIMETAKHTFSNRQAN